MDRMAENKAGGYISNITFNNDESIEIAPNDIVIFVGPNNAGKSQALKDIFSLSAVKCPSIVISDINIIKYPGNVVDLLDEISTPNYKNGHKHYQIMGSTITVYDNLDSIFNSPGFDFLKNLFVAYLDTTARLISCLPPQSITRNAPKQHPIHYAAFNPDYRKWLGENFKQAFGTEIIPNILFGERIPLCIGEPFKFTTEYDDEQTRMEAYADVLQGYKQVQDQGDGIKSFTGILLYLMLDYYCTYLIDEPESFLHPPQARIMGQIIGKTLSDQQQAFISTHSEDIIKGLLETCPQRLKIIRITRDGDTNHFSVLNNEKFSEVWNDPLLKHSNIMSSLFHKTVVLCESDSDCQMYSAIESHIKQKQGKYSEALFIHCGGKQRMARVITALRALNVDVKLIPDIDVLNDEEVVKGIVNAYGIEWETIKPDYKKLVSNLHSPKEKINRSTVKEAIQQVLDGKTDQALSSEEIKQIQETIKTISKWDSIKKMGVSAIPAGDATTAFRRLNTVLKAAGIFLVPVGELECFIKEVGGHGPTWVNNVFEDFSDFDNEVYNDITKFISELGL